MNKLLVLVCLIVGINAGVSSNPTNLYFSLVSDANDWVVSPSTTGKYAVPVSSLAGTWTTIPGATWIWDGTSNTIQTVTYTKSFYVPCTTNASATLLMVNDNTATVTLNGKNAGCDHGDSYTSVYTCSLGSQLVTGTNTLSIAVTNSGGPAGLAYKLTVQAQVYEISQ
jgi:hypothetical protein